MQQAARWPWILLAFFMFVLGGLLGWQLGDGKASLSGESRRPSAPPRKVGEIHAYALVGDKVQTIKPQGACSQKGWEYVPLVVRPGSYCIDGRQFYLKTGGVRVYRLYGFSRFFIVNDGNLMNLLSALAWMSTHGNQDEARTLPELEEVAKHGKISLRCGYLAGFAQHLLRQMGYETRTVYMHTLKGPDELDNQGYILFEIKDAQGRWILVDLTTNRVFRDKRGRLMNAYEVAEAFKSGHFAGRLQKLASDPLYDVSGFQDPNYDYSFYSGRFLGSEETLLAWYGRVFQVPLQADATFLAFPYDGREDPALYAKVQRSYGVRLVGLQTRAFLQKYYASPRGGRA